MNSLNRLYTYAICGYCSNDYKNHLRTFNINCVIDLRNVNQANSSLERFNREMREFLATSGIYYMNFHEPLVAYDDKNYTKKGNWNYNCCLRNDDIVSVLNRIIDGVSKGYTILLIDDETRLRRSIRYKLVGAYMKQCSIDVIHILPNGRYFTHSQLEQEQESKKNKALILGKRGEDVAVEYLRNHGYVILDRNWKADNNCELDIVAHKDDKFHFVEVKTRSSSKIVPVEAIDKRKVRNILKAISNYRHANGYTSFGYTLDSIAVVYHSDDDYTVNLFENLNVFTGIR